MSSTAPRAGARLLRRHRAAAVAVALAACGHAPGAPTVDLWLGGDVHLGDADASTAGARLAALRPLTFGALGVVNLEGPVSAAPPRHGELANHPAALPALRAAGVRVVGVANNHAGDGAAPPAATVATTVDAARAAGLTPAGRTAGVAVISTDGLRIAVSAHELAVPVDRDGLAAELARARRAGDVLVATFHVTAPPTYLPPAEAVTAVALARAAGAAVIAVHGSHALARVERTADGVTAWGLGNLAFACACTDEADGLLLRVTLDRHGLVDAAVLPLTAGLRGQPAAPADEPTLVYQLLAALRSTPLVVDGPRATLVRPDT